MDQEKERALATALADSEVPREEIQRLSAEAGTRFELGAVWRGLVADENLDEWRRLIAYQLFLDRCLAYPAEKELFEAEAIIAFGFDPAEATDITRGAYVPVSREEGERVNMLLLPINTPIGAAALYYSVLPSGGKVEDAIIHPSGDSF